MDHLIFLEEAWKEIEELLKGNKTMIIQGFDEINEPHWEIAKGDMLFFTYNGGKNEIRAKAVADDVFHSQRLSREESFELIIRNQEKLMLPDDMFYRWAGKKYLLLIGLSNIEPFETEVEHVFKPRQISA